MLVVVVLQRSRAAQGKKGAERGLWEIGAQKTLWLNAQSCHVRARASMVEGKFPA